MEAIRAMDPAMQRKLPRCRRPAALAAAISLFALAGCANPAKDQYFIPIDAIEPGAGIFSTGEAIPAEAYPVAVRSAVITGPLLVGGEVAQELVEGPLVEADVEVEADATTVVVLSDAQATLDPDTQAADIMSPNAQRAVAFAALTEAQQNVLVADSDRALLLEAWMESRIEPVSMTRTDVLRAQQLLARLGYDPGPRDGIFGRRTSSAIEQFQSARGLPVTGQLSPALMDRLALELS